MGVSTRAEQAVTFFNNGFNCSQAVFASFAEDYGVPEELALRIATQFGSGARCGEICGAVSGALMVLGLQCGHIHADSKEEYDVAHRKAEEFIACFKEKQGTVVCRELLGYDVTKPEDMAEIRKQGLFDHICPQMVRCAVEIVEEML